MPKETPGFQLPADLASLSDADLESQITHATTEFDAMSDGDDTPDLERYGYLADSIEAMRGEKTTRDATKAQLAADAQAIRDRVHPPAPAEPVAAAVEPVPDPAPVVAPPAPAPVPVAAVTQVTPAAQGAQSATAQLVAGGPMQTATRKLNPTLADIRAAAPATKAPDRPGAVLVASSDIPGVPHASRLSDYDALVAAMTAKARTLPIATRGEDTTWYPVASLPLQHKYMLDLQATPKQIDEVLQAAANPDALVAAGGWCSPSEISYDFFNIVCEDGILDLPSVGINRGGMRWPTSPTFADVIAGTNAFFTWTETQDVAAVTGTAQSGTKACGRVPCPDFNEERLRCDGLCLTVGNLMEDAYPENIANHLRLLMAGHAHRMNGLRISALLGLSSSLGITGLGAAGSGVVAPVLGAIELQAIDYRERFAMCEDAVLEVVLPRWLRGAMRSDLRKRTGVDLLEVADSRLMNFFDLINVRVQWVTDWQSRASGYPGYSAGFITEWPTSVQFLMYAAGTFVWGRGLQLNLGVIRDSVLNETNDHTGAWQEECWLVAKIGHESRLGTVNICTDGTTGAADLTACGL